MLTTTAPSPRVMDILRAADGHSKGEVVFHPNGSKAVTFEAVVEAERAWLISYLRLENHGNSIVYKLTMLGRQAVAADHQKESA